MSFLPHQRVWSNKLLTGLMRHPHTREKRSTGVRPANSGRVGASSQWARGVTGGAEDGEGKGNPGHQRGGERMISRLCGRKEERKDPGEKGNPGGRISRLCSAGMSNATRHPDVLWKQNPLPPQVTPLQQASVQSLS